jgi:hypothetical protein
MGVNGACILQKRLYEGTETCQKGLCVCVCVCVFASLHEYEKKIKLLPEDVCQ